MGVYQFKREQTLKVDVEKLWDFISSPENLKKITPQYMGFDIISKANSRKMYEGMIIIYKVSPLPGIKTTWVTEISHIREGHYFVDEQRAGPYKLWHHEHILKPVENGTLMTDIISYMPPFGFLGSIANKLFIRKKLEEIFDHRFKVLEELYGNK